MNKNGQTLIIFVILIPIILTTLAIVVDVGILVHEFQRTRGILDDGIREYFENYEEEDIPTLLRLNDIPIENLEIRPYEDKVEVSIQYSIDSLFGKLINIKNYEIKINRIGKKENETVMISKKE